MLSAQYNDSEALANRIRELQQKSKIVSTSSIVKTLGGKDIFLVRLGTGDVDNKPGIAVIGGVSGYSLASTEIVMQMIEKMISQNPGITDEVSFYFIPDVTPDASARYFAPVKYEREENANPYDDDRDWKTDEDGYDDLNKDGFISWMRIKDTVKGEWFVHPENPSVMVKADITKNEKGDYIVIREGIDNDKDGKINEDNEGGVIFNKNFSFNYPYFTHGAGINAFSEEETRALARFLFDHFNIFAVLCIGPDNNLSKYSDLKAGILDKIIPAVIPDDDKPYFERTVHLYNSLVKLNEYDDSAPKGGDLLSWSYFHYTRYAFSTPAWNVMSNKNNMGSRDFDYLKWASDNKFDGQVIEWQKIQHPDFPRKEVEVGGIKPFLSLNPPIEALDTVSSRHLDFLKSLAGMHPELSFNDIKVEKRNPDLYYLQAEITNTGKFPTMTSLAVNSKWVKIIQLEANLAQKQEIIGGRKTFQFYRIKPGETVKGEWLIKGKGTVKLKTGSPQTGFISKDVELK